MKPAFTFSPRFFVDITQCVVYSPLTTTEETMQTFKNNKEEDWKTFRTLAELQAMTEQEKRGIEVEFDIFERMTCPILYRKSDMPCITRWI